MAVLYLTQFQKDICVFSDQLQYMRVDGCRSWLERQQNCPTCRASVFAPEPGAQPQDQGAADAAAGAADPVSHFSWLEPTFECSVTQQYHKLYPLCRIML